MWTPDIFDPETSVLLVYRSAGYDSQGSNVTVKDTRLIEPKQRVTRQPLACCCRRGIFIGSELCLQHTVTRFCDPKGPTAQLRLGALLKMCACGRPGCGETNTLLPCRLHTQDLDRRSGTLAASGCLTLGVVSG